MKKGIKIIRLVLVVLMLGIGLTGIGCSKAQKRSIAPSSIEKPEAEYVKGEILVKFKKGTTKERIAEINQGLGVAEIKILSEQELYHLRISEDATVPEMVKKYQDIPEVEYTQPNYNYRLFQKPVLK